MNPDEEDGWWNGPVGTPTRQRLRTTAAGTCRCCGSRPARPHTQTEWAEWLMPVLGSRHLYSSWERGQVDMDRAEFEAVTVAFRATIDECRVLFSAATGDGAADAGRVDEFRVRQAEGALRLPTWTA